MEADATRRFRYNFGMMDRWVREALAHAKLSQAEATRRLQARFNWPDDRSILNKMTLRKRGVEAAEAIQIADITGYPLPVDEPSSVDIEVWKDQFINAAKQATALQVPPGELAEWMMEGIRAAFSDILRQAEEQGHPLISKDTSLYQVIVGPEDSHVDQNIASTGKAQRTPTSRAKKATGNRTP